MNIKLLFDHNLGKEARYCCYLGIDSYWLEKPLSLSEIKDIVEKEGSFFIHTRKGKYFFSNLKLQTQFLENRLVEIFSFFSVKREELQLFQRCFPCNQETLPVSRKDYVKEIPPHSYEYGEDFRICKKCGKLYWKGSHYKNLKEFIDLLFRKYFSVCSLCRKLIPADRVKYELNMELKSTYDMLIIDKEKLVHTEEELEDLLKLIEKTSQKKLEEDVYLKKEYILCGRCRDRFLEQIENFFGDHIKGGNSESKKI